jgi:TRAP transporter TAXI family solute receptor
MKCFARVIFVIAALAASTAATAQNKVTISVATGPTTGVYYPLGGGIANVLSKYVPGYAANAETTAGSVANLQLMSQKKSDIALSMADAAWDGYKGQGRFASGAVAVRTLMIAYPNRMHVVTVEGTGINKFTDLKGKRVSTGAANSATELMAARVLEAMGVDQEKDIKRERLDPGKSSDAIKDKKLDAYFWVGGIPTAAVTDLGATPGTKLKLIDHAEAVEAMNKKHGPLYVQDTIPAKSYPGQEQPNQVATVQNLIIAREDMPDEVAYNIVKTIFDKRDELILVHKEAQNFDLKFQTNAASPIPFHPGAIKYFAERGITLK